MTTSWKRELAIIAILTIGAAAYSVYNIYAGLELNEGLLKLKLA
jgi:hypothetical protein